MFAKLPMHVCQFPFQTFPASSLLAPQAVSSRTGTPHMQAYLPSSSPGALFPHPFLQLQSLHSSDPLAQLLTPLPSQAPIPPLPSSLHGSSPTPSLPSCSPLYHLPHFCSKYSLAPPCPPGQQPAAISHYTTLPPPYTP